MANKPAAGNHYAQWLAQLKTRFRQVQLKAAVAVNAELLQFYWALGADMVERQADAPWGSGFLARLSQDLMQEFPEVKGFSRRNLEHIRRWHQYWNSHPNFAKQAASQLFAIPWWHKDRLVAEYALSDIHKPLGLASYHLSHDLPEMLRDKLPSIEQLEAELGGMDE